MTDMARVQRFIDYVNTLPWVHAAIVACDVCTGPCNLLNVKIVCTTRDLESTTERTRIVPCEHIRCSNREPERLADLCLRMFGGQP